ncbi:hypothetical protein CLV93_110111 [Prolixibacter denitrificans]|uniref:Uncharacterized protein n=1 Tax=Prolixibacter denitrificans TaxID=1541063 RepID=A0A2P8C8P4_9BACT|nr:hypothetical protein CLV93_110111 [Prolixibacter denitrificans]
MKQARQNLATQMDGSKAGYIEYLQEHRRVDDSRNSSQFVKLESSLIRKLVHVHNDPYKALKDSHAIAVLTEWDETKFDEVNSAPTTGQKSTKPCASRPLSSTDGISWIGKNCKISGSN